MFGCSFRKILFSSTFFPLWDSPQLSLKKRKECRWYVGGANFLLPYGKNKKNDTNFFILSFEQKSASLPLKKGKNLFFFFGNLLDYMDERCRGLGFFSFNRKVPPYRERRKGKNLSFSGKLLKSRGLINNMNWPELNNCCILIITRLRWLSQRKGKFEFKLLILSVYSVMLLHSNTIFFSLLLTVLIALLSYM